MQTRCFSYRRFKKTKNVQLASSFCRPLPLCDYYKALTTASATDWILVRDWSMELANQLLGRIRNRLSGYALVVDPKSPTAVSGHPLAVSIRARKADPFQFATASKQTVRVWFAATPGANFEQAILRKPDPPPTVPKEGEVLVF